MINEKRPPRKIGETALIIIGNANGASDYLPLCWSRQWYNCQLYFTVNIFSLKLFVAVQHGFLGQKLFVFGLCHFLGLVKELVCSIGCNQGERAIPNLVHNEISVAL